LVNFTDVFFSTASLVHALNDNRLLHKLLVTNQPLTTKELHYLPPYFLPLDAQDTIMNTVNRIQCVHVHAFTGRDASNSMTERKHKCVVVVYYITVNLHQCYCSVNLLDFIWKHCKNHLVSMLRPEPLGELTALLKTWGGLGAYWTSCTYANSQTAKS